MITIKDKLYLHRGYYNNKTIPENSIKAFKLAKELNINIELDIRDLKDNTIVVFHDKNLLRMCNKNININKLTIQELNNYNLLNTNYKIPTLVDVLKLINNQVKILIEIKHLSKRNYKTLINILNNYNGEIYLQTFNKNTINYFYKNKPTYKIGLLLLPFYNITKYIIKTPYKKINFIASNKLNVTPKYYKYLSNKNKKLVIWTIKDKEELFKYQNISDYFIIKKETILHKSPHIS